MCPLWLARSPPRRRLAPGLFCAPAAFSYTIRVSRQTAANHVVNGGGQRTNGRGWRRRPSAGDGDDATGGGGGGGLDDDDDDRSLANSSVVGILGGD